MKVSATVIITPAYSGILEEKYTYLICNRQLHMKSQTQATDK